MLNYEKKTFVVMPCYKVRNKVMTVLNNKKLSKIDKIVIIDDQCPENTGFFLKKKLKKNNKYKIIIHKKNQGVGGATITGMKYALKNKFDMVIKVDGDGQHNLSIIRNFKKEILNNKFDFCKGYRKLSLKKRNMPIIRLLGARSLTFLTKLNSGNWNIKDPCHGLIALRCDFLRKINLNKIRKNWPYFLIGGASLTHEQAIEEVIKKNLDMVTWARHILANPDFVSKLKNGEKMLEMTNEMRINLQ